MARLETYHVDDWAKFIEENDIDLSCPVCRGEKDECEECSGTGYLEIMWNTIWDTGFRAGSRSIPASIQGVAAFEHNGNIWFGLQGCGMDMTPYLAAAWVELFPDCQWLPEQFIGNSTNLRGGYIESCVGKKLARRIYAVIGKTVKGMRQQATWLAEDLKEARKRLTSSPA